VACESASLIGRLRPFACILIENRGRQVARPRGANRGSGEIGWGWLASVTLLQLSFATRATLASQPLAAKLNRIADPLRPTALLGSLKIKQRAKTITA